MDAATPRAEAHLWLDLSAAQRAVWLEMHALAAPPGYQLGGWARVDDALDLDIARQAVSLVMARHDALRLRVDSQQPRQRLDASVTPPVVVSDLRGAADPEGAFQAFAAQAFASAMPLGDAPLFQVDFVQAGARRWYALWRCHHLIADATSVGIALQRWTEAYEALSGEDGGELSAPSSFVAGLADDRAYEASPQHEADLAYWQARFSTLPEPVFAPAPPGPPAPALCWQLAGAEYAAFASACRGCGVTTQRALLALLALVLARTYGRRDVAVGLALHRRGFATREVLGMLAGLLPVRCRVDPSASLADGVRAIAAGLDQDFRHQRVSLDALGRTLNPTAPLFDTVVSHLIDESAPHAGAGGLYRGPEVMPLALYAVERPGVAIRFELACNSAFVDAAQCQSLASGLQRAIACLVADPGLAVDAFDPLSAADHALLAGWSGSVVSFPVLPLPALFALQACRTPAAPAVSEGGRTLSYAALDAASDALAAGLQGRGVGLAAVVGVALRRSIETVVAVLGILKAGGAYLPLDPATPPPRLAAMLADAGAALVLTTLDVAPSLPAGVAQWLPWAAGGGLGAPGLGAPGARPRAVALRPGHLAYVVYTSGSTGLPKGVAVSHAAAANLAQARRHGHDPLGPGDRVLAAIAVGFDVSIGQLLLPLLAGACVVVAPDLRTLSGPGFWALLAAAQVSHVNSVPSFLDSVLDAAPPDSGLARLMLGGEALSGALCRRLRAALPGTELVNMYGPTEACIDATAFVVPGDAQAVADGVQPFGRPLANVRAWVLDARLRLVPPGVAGALFLGGAGLARGYVGQAGLTAWRFVPDPFGPPGTRLYRTGDRARWGADGALVFLGREDAQVKIRGFRVEPGEVEAALRAHPGVAQAAVAARPGPGETAAGAGPAQGPSAAAGAAAAGSLRLVAWVVPATPGDLPGDLRAHLEARLPSHMLPAAFVHLTAMPLTNNGKLDYKALDAGVAAPVGPLTARDATEFRLQRLWQDVLGQADIGLHDDFFEIGGSSLLAIRLIGACNAAFGAALPVAALFTHRTVEAMAAALRQSLAAPAAQRLVVLQPGDPAVPPLVCLHPQGGTVFCYGPLVRHLPPTLPVLGLQAAGLEAGEAPPAALVAMAADYVAALRAAHPAGPYRLLGYSFGGIVAFEMAHQLRAAGEAVSFLGLLDSWRPGGSQAPSGDEADMVAMLGRDLGLPQPPRTSAGLFAAARAAGVLPPDATLAQVERIVALLVGNARLAQGYAPSGGLSAAMLQVRAARRGAALPDWAPLVDAAVETLDLDCTHEGLIGAAMAPALAAAIAPRLHLQETQDG